MNQKKQLIKNTIIIAIGKLSTQVISFLLLPLYTSKLTPGEYGTYDFLVTISIFLLPLITMLMEESMFRFLIDAETVKSKRKIVTSTIIYTIFGTIIFTILASIVMLILKYEYGLVFILFVISNIMLGLSNCLSRGTGKIKMYSLSNFILGAMTIVLNLFFILELKLGVSGLLWANTIANALTAIIVLYKLNLKKYVSKKSASRKTLTQMIKYSVPLVPNNLSWVIISLADRAMLTWMIGSQANGIYSIANRFPSIVHTCYGFFSIAWKESAAKILKEENKSKYYNSIYHDMKLFLKAIVLGLIAVMPFAFPLLIDSSYKDAYTYIPILIISIYYTNISNFYGGIYSAFKDTKIMGITTMGAAVINIVINFIFIPIYGIYAATFSTLLSNLAVYIYRRIKLRDYIRLKENFNIMYWIFIIGVLVTYYINNMILNVIALIIVIIYCVYTNRKFLKFIVNKISNKKYQNKMETE